MGRQPPASARAAASAASSAAAAFLRPLLPSASTSSCGRRLLPPPSPFFAVRLSALAGFPRLATASAAAGCCRVSADALSTAGAPAKELQAAAEKGLRTFYTFHDGTAKTELQEAEPCRGAFRPGARRPGADGTVWQARGAYSPCGRPAAAHARPLLSSRIPLAPQPPPLSPPLPASARGGEIVGDRAGCCPAVGAESIICDRISAIRGRICRP